MRRETKTERGIRAREVNQQTTSPQELPSFEQIFRDNYKFVRHAVARSLGPDNPDLDDVVQEVFLVAFRKLDSYDRKCQITTWLWGLTWRVASHHRRRQKLRQFFGSSRDPDPTAINPTHPEREYLARQGLRDVYTILDRMSERKRQVLILYELDGYSGPEIAKILGCSQATVWTHLHVARKEFMKRTLRAANNPQWSQPSVQMTGRNGE